MADASGYIDFIHPRIPEGGFSFPCFDRVIEAYSHNDVIPSLQDVSDAVRQGNYAYGFLAYEAASAFDSALVTHSPQAGWPMVWFGISKRPVQSDPDCYTAVQPDPQDWKPEWQPADYLSRFQTVMDALERGDSYQVNLTFGMHGSAPASDASRYAALRNAQNSQYCGMIRLGENAVLSSSPELFFRVDGRSIQTRPMKGTRPRGITPERDEELRRELQQSEKEQAENLMIVDLLRNDLGRVCETGSINVPVLMDCEQYPTVWQMTSTVEGVLREGAGLVDIFRALFPCGSVTGAPKVKTMDIIRSLESSPRGVYCGAFGIVFPGGDCLFNVPIRTLCVSGREAIYRIGSGIVLDSKGQEEYEECLVKARVLDAPTAPFYLFETMLWEPKSGYALLEEHEQRLMRSARFFGFPVNSESVLLELKTASKNWNASMRVRLMVFPDGRMEIESTTLPEMPEVPTVVLANEPIDSTNPFLYHKTSRREMYESQRAHCEDAFDVLLYNERGELTESTIANIAVCLRGRWFTPPVSSGLLPGTQRAWRLKRGEISERVIPLEELAEADGIQLMNSVRGVFDVKMLSAPVRTVL